MPTTTAKDSPYASLKLSPEDRAFCEKLWAPPPEDLFAPVGKCRSTNKEVTICYNAFGNPAHPCVLLIMGLGAPAPYWDSRFCRDIAAHGFFVIRYDNRDVGLSTHFDELKAPFILRLGIPRWLSLGEGKPPYTLRDMAADAVGLLDHLKVDAAHIVGCSMGGMIAQELILNYPERVRSLCMHSTSTGVPMPKPRLLLRLLDKPKNDSLEEVIKFKDRFFSAQVGNYTFPRHEFLLGMLLTHTRCNYEAGQERHLTAIARGGDRTAALKAKVNPRMQRRLAPIRGSGYVALARDIYNWAMTRLRGAARVPPTVAEDGPATHTAPARLHPKNRNASNSDIPIVILHGGADMLIPVENAKKLAQTLAGSKLVIMPDMGHYFSAEVFKPLTDEIALNARRGELNADEL